MSVSAPAHTGDPPLPVLLAKAVRSPECVITRDGGAVLALSIHCFFVRAGFRDVAYKRGSPYCPQHNWNVNPDAWVFRYRKPGLANKFTFTCGLKQVTSQAYVHVEEENNAENVAFMGLNLSKYVQDPALLRRHTWEGVLSYEEDLEAYFHEYLVTPILSRAMHSSESSNKSTGNRTRLTQAGIGLVATGAMLVLVGKARRKPGRRRPLRED